MAIKTGIGIGAAQVFDTSGLVNNFAKMLQKKQQDEAKFQAEIADIISKVDTRGVRDKDKAEIAKMYSATKDLYAQAAATKNFQDKALLKAKISKAVSDINDYAARSMQFVKDYTNQAEDMLKNPWAYDPKVKAKFDSLKDKSLIEMGEAANLNPMDYQRMPNPKIADDIFNDIYKASENFATSKRVDTGGGFYTPVKIASNDKLLSSIETKLAQYPEYFELATTRLKQSNPDAAALDAESLRQAVLNNELALYLSTKGNQYVGEEKQYRKESKGDTIIIGGDSIQPKTFASEDTVKIGKDRKVIKDASGNPVVVPGKPVLEFSKFVSVNPEQFSMPQLGKRFNVTAGKWEEFKPSGNVEIVGVGTRAGSNAYNVVVKDKDGVEYMVTDQDLPLGIRNNKIYKAAKASVYVPRAAQPAPSPKPKPNSDPLGLFK